MTDCQNESMCECSETNGYLFWGTTLHLLRLLSIFGVVPSLWLRLSNDSKSQRVTQNGEKNYGTELCYDSVTQVNIHQLQGTLNTFPPTLHLVAFLSISPWICPHRDMWKKLGKHLQLLCIGNIIIREWNRWSSTALHWGVSGQNTLATAIAYSCNWIN